jgi:hypothetical protein
MMTISFFQKMKTGLPFWDFHIDILPIMIEQIMGFNKSNVKIIFWLIFQRSWSFLTDAGNLFIPNGKISEKSINFYNYAALYSLYIYINLMF